MIKDTVQLQGFPQMKLPKLKGTVEIKLHNPTTGKTTVERGENMITNAMSDIFASNYCGALDYRKLLPLYNKMYGGILCFSKALDVSSQNAADDYFIPDGNPSNGNPVTAHAGQTSFSTQDDDYTRGVPSNVTVSDGIATMSWEWGLSAGNGAIASLALTHTDVGDAGTGSTSNAFKAIKPAINASFNTYSNKNAMWTHNQSSANNMVFFVGIDGYGYRFTASGNTITLIKIPFAYTQTGLVARQPFVDGDLTATKTITTNTTYSSGYNPSYCYVAETNRLWIFYSTNVGKVVKVEEINLADWGTQNWHATNHDNAFNNLDVNVLPLYNGHPSQVVAYSNGSVYFPKTAASDPYVTGFLRVNLTNTADQSNLTANVVPFGGTFPAPSAHKIVAGNQFVINNNALYPCTPSEDINGTGINNISRYQTLDQKVGLANLCSYYRYNNANDQSYYVAVSKFYLGTKYNLSSAVTKTPSQSMIVTYTIQEVASNE